MPFYTHQVWHQLLSWSRECSLLERLSQGHHISWIQLPPTTTRLQVSKFNPWTQHLCTVSWPYTTASTAGRLPMIIDKKFRGVARKFLEGISQSLGLESNSIIESNGFDSASLACSFWLQTCTHHVCSHTLLLRCFHTPSWPRSHIMQLECKISN